MSKISLLPSGGTNFVTPGREARLHSGAPSQAFWLLILQQCSPHVPCSFAGLLGTDLAAVLTSCLLLAKHGHVRALTGRELHQFCCGALRGSWVSHTRNICPADWPRVRRPCTGAPPLRKLKQELGWHRTHCKGCWTA